MARKHPKAYPPEFRSGAPPPARTMLPPTRPPSAGALGDLMLDDCIEAHSHDDSRSRRASGTGFERLEHGDLPSPAYGDRLHLTG